MSIRVDVCEGFFNAINEDADVSHASFIACAQGIVSKYFMIHLALREK